MKHSSPYWHPSNILYHYGDDDCPLQQGDFAEAMRLVKRAVDVELGLWKEHASNFDSTSTQGEDDTEFVNTFVRYGTNAMEALDIWEHHKHDVTATVVSLREIVTFERAQGNKDRANNFEMFADALEGDDYTSLAF